VAEVLAVLVYEPRLVSPELLEGVAQALHDRAGLEDPFPYPPLLVRSCGYEILHHPLATCGQERVFRGVVLVRPSQDARREGLAALHGLAHAEVLSLGLVASHGDVWLLTLMLAVPRRAMGSPGRELRARAWVPYWIVDLRMLVARLTDGGW
jgi:hypothetical protein